MSQLMPSTTPLRIFKERGVSAVAVFPDKRRMVTGSEDKTLRLWDLKTGVVLGKMDGHSSGVSALAVSRDGQIIASADEDGELIAWHGVTKESLTQPIVAHPRQITSLDFSPDGMMLATGSIDRTVKLRCTSTWQLQENPIECGDEVNCVRYSPSGKLLAIATDQNIEIYNSDTRRRVASFKGHVRRSSTLALAWTPDGTRLLSGGDSTIREWDTLTWEQVGHPWKGHTGPINTIAIHPAGTLVVSASSDKHVRLWRLSDRRTIAIFQHSTPTKCVTFSVDGKHLLSGGQDNKISEWAVPNYANSKILDITTARDACIAGDLSAAEEILTQEIITDANNYTDYANRSFVMARKHDWDHALQDAIKSISIQPSLTGYISKGIALYGKSHARDARTAFNVAFMFTNQDPVTVHLLLLIQAIALFNADQHEEAMLLVRELAAACPNADTLACRVVETHLHVQLGTKAWDDARHDEAAEHFTAAVNSSALSSKSIHELYEHLIVLFGWDLESLWLTAYQKRCQVFLSAGKVEKALESHKYMMDSIDEDMKASCFEWSNEFKERCSARAAHNDRILGAEIPGQEQEGHDTEPNFFRGMQGHPQTSRPLPQQRPGHLERPRQATKRTPRPVPPPAPPTTLPPAPAPIAFKTRVRQLFTRRPDHAAPPVVEVLFTKGKERNTAAGAPGNDPDIVPDEYFNDPPPDSNTQQQPHTATAQIDTGEYGGGRSCCCC